MPRFADVVPDFELLMGAKAVFAPLTSRVICFGEHGSSDTSRFSIARKTANASITRPWILTIGGGASVASGIEGRVINLCRATRSYGNTNAYILHPAEREKLAQWPTAVALLDVYEFVERPHLQKDLGLESRMVLAMAFDRVVRVTDRLAELFEAIADAPLKLANVMPLAGFVEPEKLELSAGLMPKTIAKSEGKARYVLAKKFERDDELAKLARAANREKFGLFQCESCGLRDESSSIFDVHHLDPVCLGPRSSCLSDLVVLCPTCHRIAHSKAAQKYAPLSIQEVRRYLHRDLPG